MELNYTIIKVTNVPTHIDDEGTECRIDQANICCLYGYLIVNKMDKMINKLCSNLSFYQ